MTDVLVISAVLGPVYLFFAVAWLLSPSSNEGCDRLWDEGR